MFKFITPGCRFHFGDLESFLKKDEIPYDVVSLDFLGQMCKAYVDIFECILLKEKALVMLNVQGKRERSAIQDELQYLSGHITGNSKNIFLKGAHKSFKGLDQRGKERIKNPENLKEVRDSTIALAFETAVSRSTVHFNNTLRHSLRGIRPQYLPHSLSLSDPRTLDFICSIVSQFTDILSKALNVNQSNEWGSVGSTLFGMFTTIMLEAPLVTHLQKFKYISKSKKANTPFVCDFFEMKNLRKSVTKEFRHINQFFISCVNEALKAKFDILSKHALKVDMLCYDKKGSPKKTWNRE